MFPKNTAFGVHELYNTNFELYFRKLTRSSSTGINRSEFNALLKDLQQTSDYFCFLAMLFQHVDKNSDYSKPVYKLMLLLFEGLRADSLFALAAKAFLVELRSVMLLTFSEEDCQYMEQAHYLARICYQYLVNEEDLPDGEYFGEWSTCLGKGAELVDSNTYKFRERDRKPEFRALFSSNATTMCEDMGALYIRKNMSNKPGGICTPRSNPPKPHKYRPFATERSASSSSLLQSQPISVRNRRAREVSKNDSFDKITPANYDRSRHHTYTNTIPSQCTSAKRSVSPCSNRCLSHRRVNTCDMSKHRDLIMNKNFIVYNDSQYDNNIESF